jgi:hypothetical protein
LNYGYTLKNEGHEGKTDPFEGVTVGGYWAWGKGEGRWLWWMHFVLMYENRKMKHVKIVQRWEEDERTMEGVNLIKIYWKHIWNVTMYPSWKAITC